MIISYSNLVHRSIEINIIFYGKKVEHLMILIWRARNPYNTFIIFCRSLVDSRSFNSQFYRPICWLLCHGSYSFFCVCVCASILFHSFLLIKKDYCLKALRTFPYFLIPFSGMHDVYYVYVYVWYICKVAA